STRRGSAAPQGDHDPALPFRRQRLPNRVGRPFAHRAIQASALRRTTLGTRVSAIRPTPSIYQRCHLWDIENLFCKLKAFRRIATRYEKTDESFAAIINLVGSALALR